MCGICGVDYKDHARAVSRQGLAAMQDSLTHRGPDDAGDFFGPGVALGSRRLSILDLSEHGHMPMSTPDGRYRITYNGEVYNYKELRALLEGRGFVFYSGTDTEVVLYLYQSEGPAMLDRLNGMFAFAIWDVRERTLFLARDRMGVKPLYYACQDGAFYFASEEKALFAAGVRREFDQSTWEELLCFRYVAGERTPFVGVSRLLPGNYLTWRDGDIQIRRWWNLADRARGLGGVAPENHLDWFQETFDNSVALRRISDVPVGVLLSGGLDSSSVAASLSSQAGPGAASFTVRFAEKDYDEGPLARQVADRWGLKYHELTVPPGQLLPLVQAASRFNDEPLAHGNDLHLLAISEYAKPRVTVLLSGEGGDETLGGYVRYRPLRYPALLRAARSGFPKIAASLNLNGRMRKLARFVALGSVDRFVLYNACEVLPEDLRRLGLNPEADFPFREKVLSEARALYPGDYARQAMYSDHHTFLCSILDRNDRMTMGASVECRVPFLDYRLVEVLASLPSSRLLAGKQAKSLLRDSLGDRLPDAVMRHRKWGFGVPWRSYLREVPALRDVVNDLPAQRIIREGPFSPASVRSVIDGFLKGESQNAELVRQLFMISIWHQSCFNELTLSASSN